MVTPESGVIRKSLLELLLFFAEGTREKGIGEIGFYPKIDSQG